jgi:hypothetical protein
MNANTIHKIPSLDVKIKDLAHGFDPERADAFLDEMFALLGAYGSLTCTVVENRNLRVQSNDIILGEAPIRLAPVKLSSLCARLAVRCQEWSGQELSLHGDTIEFDHPITKQRCKVYFENSAGRQAIALENTRR